MWNCTFPITIVFFILLTLSRAIFVVLFFVPAVVCENYGDIIEKCENKTIFFEESMQNKVDMVGTFLEAFNSTLMFTLILCWEIFHVWTFGFATITFGYFWFWLSMTAIVVVTVSEIDFSKGLVPLGISLIVEILSLTLLSSALHHIPKKTVYRWLQRKLGLRNRRFLLTLSYYTFHLILFVYVVRNLSLFLYDLTLTAKKISRNVRPFDSLLLVFNTAMRGSFVGFYFAKMHESVDLPLVCDNVETNYDPVIRWVAPSENLSRLSSPPTQLNAHVI